MYLFTIKKLEIELNYAQDFTEKNWAASSRVSKHILKPPNISRWQLIPKINSNNMLVG